MKLQEETAKHEEGLRRVRLSASTPGSSEASPQVRLLEESLQIERDLVDRLKGDMLRLENDVQAARSEATEAVGKLRRTTEDKDALSIALEKEQDKYNREFLRACQFEAENAKFAEMSKALRDMTYSIEDSVSDYETKCDMLEHSLKSLAKRLEGSKYQSESKMVSLLIENEQIPRLLAVISQKDSDADRCDEELIEMYGQFNKAIDLIDGRQQELLKSFLQVNQGVNARDERLRILSRELEDREGKISSQSDHMKSLSEHLKKESNELSSASEQLKARDSKISSLETEIKEFKNEVQSLESRIHNFKQKIVEKDAEIKSLQSDLSNSKKELENDRIRYDHMVSSLEGERDRLSRQMRASSASYEEKIRFHEEEITLKEQEIQLLQDKNTNTEKLLNSEINDLQFKLSRSKEDFEVLQQRNREALESSEAQLRKERKEKLLLTEEKRFLSFELQKFTIVFENSVFLSEQLVDSHRELQRHNRLLNEDCEQQRRSKEIILIEHKELQRRFFSLTRELEDTHSTVLSLTNANEQIHLKLEMTQEEGRRLKAEMDGMRNNLMQKDMEIDQSQKQADVNAKVLKKNLSLSQELLELQKHSQSLQIKLDTQARQIGELSKSKAELEEKVNDSQRRLKETQMQFDEQNILYSEVTRQKSELDNLAAQTQKRLQDVQNEYNQQRGSNAEMTQRVREVEGKLKESQSDLQTSNSKIKELEKLIAEQSKDMKALEAKMLQTQAQLQDITAKHRNQAQTSSELEQKVREAEKKARRLEDEKDKLKEQTRVQKSKITKLGSQADITKSEEARRLQELEKENGTLRANMNVIIENEETLRKQLKQAETALAQANKTLDEKLAEFEKLSKSFQDEKKAQAKLQSDLSKLSDEHEEVKKKLGNEVEILNNQLARLTENKEVSQNELSQENVTLQKENSDLSAKVQKLDSFVKRLNLEAKEQAAEAEQVKKELEQCNKKLSAAEKDFKQLQNEMKDERDKVVKLEKAMGVKDKELAVKVKEVEEVRRHISKQTVSSESSRESLSMMEEQNAKLRLSLEALEEQVAAMEKQNANLEQELERARYGLEQQKFLQEQKQKQVDELEGEMKRLRTENDRLSAEVLASLQAGSALNATEVWQ
eukprot:753023-Hanusia_phi.AAC.7